MTLRVRVRGPDSSTVLLVSPECTFGELRTQISEGLPGLADFDIIAGFPPKKLETANSLPISGVISDGESIRVCAFDVGGIKQAQPGSRMGKKAPSRGASAKPSNSKSPGTKVQPSSQSLGFGARVATLSGPLSSSSSSSSQHRRKQAPGNTPKSKSTPDSHARGKRRTKLAIGSEEDISLHLLAAVDGGGGKANKFLRAVYRRAVELQYDQVFTDSLLPRKNL